MKTIETKISKSGAKIYYVDGKRTNRENAMFIQRMNDAEARRLAKIEAEVKADEVKADTVKTDEGTEDDNKLAELFEDREAKRRAALHSSFDSDESKAARDANKAVEEFIGKVAKDLRAIAPEGLSVVASWDSADLDAPKFVVIELATDKRTCYGKIAQVKAALKVTKTVTPEEKVEKLFDAYEAQNSVAHISENGYIAAVNFQPQKIVDNGAPAVYNALKRR